MIRNGSVLWLAASLAVSGFAGRAAYVDAESFASVVELLATIISILIGVSLAVIAVLTSPFSVSENVVFDEDEAKRMTKVIKNDDEVLATGQMIFFWLYFVSLALALLFNWVTAVEPTDYNKWFIKVLACLAASVGVFGFMWSARLPLLLQRVTRQRRLLG